MFQYSTILGCALVVVPQLVSAKTLFLDTYSNVITYTTTYDEHKRDVRLGQSDNSGDLNGDGINDILISRPNYRSGSLKKAGRIYVILGATDLYAPVMSDATVIDEGSTRNDYLGVDLHYVGDINSDGYDDFFSWSDSGNGRLYFGQSDVTTITPIEFADVEDNAYNCCQYVMRQVDLNGDHNDDLVVTYYSDTYVYYGPFMPTDAIILTDADVVMTGMESQDSGDINGDGIDDLLMYDSGTFDELRVIYGRTDLPNTLAAADADITVKTRRALDWFYVGDINGDGFSDIIVTNYHFGVQQSYIILGASDLAHKLKLKQAASIVLPDAGWVGIPILVQDVTGDAIADIIMATNGTVGPYNQTTTGYIFKGQANWPTTVTRDMADSIFLGGGRIDGNENYRFISAGDSDGDHLPDLLIGAPYFNKGDPAHLYIVSSRDNDGDGMTGLAGDCDDSNSEINADQKDNTANSINDDCDRYTDEDANFSSANNGAITTVELLPYQQVQVTYADGKNQIFWLSPYSDEASNKSYAALWIPRTSYITIMDGGQADDEELYTIDGYTGKVVGTVTEYVSNDYHLNGIAKIARTTAYGEQFIIAAHHPEVGNPDDDSPTSVYLFSVNTTTGKITLCDVVELDTYIYRHIKTEGKKIKLFNKYFPDGVARFKITKDYQLDTVFYESY